MKCFALGITGIMDKYGVLNRLFSALRITQARPPAYHNAQRYYAEHKCKRNIGMILRTVIVLRDRSISWTRNVTHSFTRSPAPYSSDALGKNQLHFLPAEYRRNVFKSSNIAQVIQITDFEVGHFFVQERQGIERLRK